MANKLTCKVCGAEFELRSWNRYTSIIETSTGIPALLGGGKPPAYYDTFDCTECGCQHRVNERMPKCADPEYTEEWAAPDGEADIDPEPAADNSDEEGEDDAEH